MEGTRSRVKNLCRTNHIRFRHCAPTASPCTLSRLFLSPGELQTVRDRGDAGVQFLLRDPNRIPDEYARLGPGGLQVHGFHEDRYTALDPLLCGGFCANSALLPFLRAKTQSTAVIASCACEQGSGKKGFAAHCRVEGHAICC